MKDRLAREHAGASRQKLKRALLDQLDERHKFEPPPSLVEQEFNNVWSQVENDLSSRTALLPMRERQRKRRERNTTASPSVVCGLVWSLPKSARKNNIKVSDDQLRTATDGTSSAVPGSGATDLGVLPKEPERDRRFARALCSRTRWSTSWSSWPTSPISRFRGKNCSRKTKHRVGRGFPAGPRLVAGTSTHICHTCIVDWAPGRSAASTNRPDSSHTMPGTFKS